MNSSIKVIIDTDIGDDIDDAIALSLALGSPEIEVLGVTTVYGDVETRTRIARRVVRAWGRPDIPVIAGFERPLQFAYHPGTAPEECSQKLAIADDMEPLDSTKTAPGFIAECIRRHPGQVHILTIGAKTNVAAALCMDASLASQVAGIYSNAGYCGSGPKAPEWNIRYDPLAMRIIAQSNAPWTVIGVDVCDRIGLRRQELSALTKRDLPQTRELVKLIVLYRKFKSRPGGDHRINSIADVDGVWDSDTNTVFALLSPETMDLRRGRITIIDGPHLDFCNDPSGPHRVATAVLPESFRDELMRRLLVENSKC